MVGVMNKYEITVLKKIANTVLFPYRCLFRFHGFGSFILSMEEERMMRVAKYCRGKVLDVGCGPHNKFITHVYTNGVGIDFFPYEGVDLIYKDPTNLPYDDESFDTISLIAVGGHIPKPLRELEFREFARILKHGGRFVMTEGEPITQFLHHKWVNFLDKIFKTNIDVDTERGMEEDEEYCMPHKEILLLFDQVGMNLLRRERFQWGLNNVFVAEKR